MTDPDTNQNGSLSNWTYSTTLMSEWADNVTSGFTSDLYNQTTENLSMDYTEQTKTGATSVTTAANIVVNIQNLTRGINDSLINSTQSSSAPDLTTKPTICSTTEEPFDEFGPPEGVEYIFVPLGVMVFVIILSAVVLIISRKRKLERLRHRLMPLYNFDPGEEGEDDWETELLDENFDSRQKRQGYQSMDTEENAELFSGR